MEIAFYYKMKKSLFEPPVSGLRSNVCTPSIPHWKGRGWLSIHHDWKLFTISYGWYVISRNQSRSTFFEGGGSLSANISEGRGVAHQSLLVSET